MFSMLWFVWENCKHGKVCSIVWFFSPFISLMYQLITDLQYKTYHSNQSNTWQTDTIKLYFYISYSFVLCLGKTEDENMLWIAHRACGLRTHLPNSESKFKNLLWNQNYFCVFHYLCFGSSLLSKDHIFLLM